MHVFNPSLDSEQPILSSHPLDPPRALPSPRPLDVTPLLLKLSSDNETTAEVSSGLITPVESDEASVMAMRICTDTPASLASTATSSQSAAYQLAIDMNCTQSQLDGLMVGLRGLGSVLAVKIDAKTQGGQMDGE